MNADFPCQKGSLLVFVCSPETHLIEEDLRDKFQETVIRMLDLRLDLSKTVVFESSCGKAFAAAALELDCYSKSVHCSTTPQTPSTNFAITDNQF